MKKKLSIIAIILSFFSLFLLGCETQNESIGTDCRRNDRTLYRCRARRLHFDTGK